MKTTKIKRYRLGVSRTFPKGHPRAWQQPTEFVIKIIHAITPAPFLDDIYKKLHTIRANYPLWESRMKEVQAGRAVIELFYWEGKPRRSKQIVFATLDKDSGCGVQIINPNNEFSFWYIPITDYIKGISKSIYVNDLAKNDGLSLDDFKAWFKGYDLSNPMAIIHFTKFRY